MCTPQKLSKVLKVFTDVPDGNEVRKIRKSFPGDFPVSILAKFWHVLFLQFK